MATKLTVLEKTAKKMFNTEMELNNVLIDQDKIMINNASGVKLTSDRLLQMAQKDLPKTIELLSKLYTTGELSSKTLSKMFTGRQSSYLVAQLGLINGDIDTYIDNTTKAQKVSDDYKKAMLNWATEMKKARNSILALKEGFSEFLDNVGAPMLNLFNSLVKWINKLSNSKGIGKFFFNVAGGIKDVALALALFTSIANLASLTAKLTGIGKALSFVKTTLLGSKTAIEGTATAMSSMAGSTGFLASTLPKLLTGIGLVVGVTSLLYSVYNRYRKEQELARVEQLKQRRELEEQLKILRTTESSLKVQLRTYAEISKIDMVGNIQKGYDLITAMVDEAESLSRLLELGGQLSSIRMPNFKDSINIAKELREEYKNIKKETEERYRVENEEFRKLEKKYSKRIEQDKEYWGDRIKEVEDKSSKILAIEMDYEKQSLKMKKILSEEEKVIYSNVEKYREFKKKEYLDAMKKSETEYYNKIKELMGKDFEAYTYFTLEKQKIESNSIDETYAKMLNFANKSKKLFSETEIGKNLKINAEPIMDLDAMDLIRQNEGKSYAEIVTEGDILAVGKFLDYLKSSNNELAKPFAEVYNKRLKVMGKELENVNKFFTSFQNKIDQSSKILNSIKVDAFKKIIGTKEVETFEEYIKQMEKYGVITSENKGISSDFRKEIESIAKDIGREDFSIDLLVENKSLLEGVTTYKTLIEFTDDLEESIKSIRNSVKDGLGLSDVDKEKIEELAKVFGIAKEDIEAIVTGEGTDINKAVEELKKKSENALKVYLESLIVASKTGKNIKDVTMDMFFYYDKTYLRQLQLNESMSKGYEKQVAVKEVLKEQENISKAKYDFEMKSLKLIKSLSGGTANISDTESLESTLMAEKQKLETKKSSNSLTKDDVELYKQIEKALSLIDKRQEDVKSKKEKEKQADEEIVRLNKEKNDYYDDLISKYNEMSVSSGNDMFANLVKSTKNANQEIDSQADLMEILKNKQKELKKLKNDSKDISDVQKDKLNQELEVLSKILGIYNKINESQLNQLNDLKIGFKEIEQDLTGVFEELYPKSLNKRISEGYDKLKSLSGENLFDRKSLLNYMQTLKTENENILSNIQQKQRAIESGNLSNEEVKQIQAQIKELEKKLKLNKEITQESIEQEALEKEKARLLTESIQSMSTYISAMAKGEIPQFNADSAISGGMGVLGGLFSGEKNVLHGQDYMQLAGMAVGVMDNIMNKSIEAQKAQLEADLNILEIRKKFARNEEDIAEIDKEILENKKKQIDMQMKSQTGFLGASGVEGGFLEGAFSGTMAGAASGNPVVAVVGGVLGGISGLMGGDEAEKQAERQKEQIELQYTANELLTQQNTILSNMNKAIDTLSDSMYMGLSRAISSSISELVEKPSFIISSENREGKRFSQKDFSEDWFNLIFSNLEIEPPTFTGGDEEMANTTFDFGLSYAKEGYNKLNNLKLENISDLSKASEIIEDINTGIEIMNKVSSSDSTQGEELLLNKEILQAFKEQLETLQRIYAEREDVLIGSYFGFDIEKIEDEAGNLQDIMSGAWKPREDIINNIIKSSFDVGEAVANSFLSGYSSYVTANNEVLQTGLDEIENSFADLFKNMAGTFEYDSNEYGAMQVDKMMDLQEASRTGRTIQEVRQERILKNIINTTQELEEEQLKIQQTAIEINKEYVKLGGNISDLVSNMTEIETALYDTLKEGSFSDLGDAIGEQISQGIMATIQDSFTQIFDYEEEIRNLQSVDFIFGEDFVNNINDVISAGIRFNDITKEQIFNQDYIKESLLSIGYTEEQITDELISQFQKQLYINYALEERNESNGEYIDQLFQQEKILNDQMKYYDELSKTLRQLEMTDEEKKIDDIRAGVEEIQRLANIDISVQDILDLNVDELKKNIKTSRDLLGTLFPSAEEGVDFTIDYDTQEVEFIGEKAQERLEIYTKEKEEQEQSESILNDILGISKDLKDNEEDILTLKEDISKLESDISRNIEEYVTKLYDGRFQEQNILDILKQQENLSSKRLANEVLTNNVAKEWVQNGGKITDIYDSLSDTGKSVYDAISDALNADSYEDSVDSLNDFLQSKLSEVWNKFYMDNYGGRITELTSKLTQSMQTGISFTAAQSVASEIQKLNLQGESQRQRLLALQDMLSTNQEISYDTSTQNVEYSTGTTAQNVYNYYNNLSVSGVVPLTKSSINEFSSVIIDRIIKELKNRKAI